MSRFSIGVLCALAGMSVCQAQAPAPGAAAREPQRSFALVVGLSQYARINPLQYAAADASQVGEALSDHGFQVVRLLDADATRAQILKVISDVTSRVLPRDQVVLYFAGHVLYNDARGGEPYFIAFDTEPEYPEVAGIPVAEILEYLAELSHRANAQLWLDLASTPPSQRQFAERPDPLTYSFNGYRGDLGSGAVLVALAPSFVSDTGVRGPSLADAIASAFESGYADTNRDGSLTVTEFHSFVRYQLLGAEKTRFLSNELPTVSTIYGGTDWPMLSLGATNIPEIDFATKQRDLHFQSLSRLGDQRLISVRTRLWAESLLDHWVATVEQSTTLPDQEQRALEDVMIILGAPSGDRVKAEALEEVQSDVYAVQPPRPPGISIQ